MKLEKRFIPHGGCAIRAEEGSEKIVGLAVPFDSLSEDLGGFRERFLPGAISKEDRADVYASFNHESSMILGRTPNTLELSEDKRGISYEIDPPDTTAGRDVSELIRRGDVVGSSFTFSLRTNGEEWSEDDDGNAIRTIKSARLHEIAPVVNPAYPTTDTSVAQRSMDEWKAQNVPEPNDLEQYELRQRLTEATL